MRSAPNSGGHFFIGRLEPGIHEVELDPTALPIELSPERVQLFAEVAPSASTRVDFVVRLVLGIAGRVTDEAGQPVVGAAVVVVAQDGQEIVRGSTDTFGLYRLDAVTPGHYAVRVVRGEKILGSRPVTLAAEYVFNQDVVVPAEPARGLQAGLEP